MTNQKPKSERLFGLKYVLSLASGLIIVGLLTALIWEVVRYLIGGGNVVEPGTFGYGVYFVGLISALLVFGSIYVITTWQAGKIVRAKRAETKWVRVLAIIFSSLMLIPAITFLIMLIVPLVSLGVGTASNDVGASVSQCVAAGVSFILIAKMIAYHLGTPKWLGRSFYVPIFTVFTILMIALFMIFPGSNVRGAASDKLIVDDLEKISFAIGRYTDKNDVLPVTLGDLGDGKLNHPITNYEYHVVESDKATTTYSYTVKYELCTDGFIANTSGGGYWSNYTTRYADFDVHNAGRSCFTNSEYIYSSGKSVETPSTVSTDAREDYNYFEDSSF